MKWNIWYSEVAKQWLVLRNDSSNALSFSFLDDAFAATTTEVDDYMHIGAYSHQIRSDIKEKQKIVSIVIGEVPEGW